MTPIYTTNGEEKSDSKKRGEIPGFYFVSIFSCVHGEAHSSSFLNFAPFNDTGRILSPLSLSLSFRKNVVDLARRA